jgi:glycosyltransferase involved in cell wall biosynthesis
VGPIVVVLATNQRRGAEIQGARLAQSLAERGHDARAVALEAGQGSELLDVAVLARRGRSVAALRALRRTVRGAVVVAHGSTTLPAVALATMGTRVRWVYRSIGDPQAWVRGPLHRARTASLLALADGVVTLWEGSAETMTSLYRVPPGKLSVIPNNRDPDEFPPVSADQRHETRAGLGLEGPAVLFLGALSEEKRPLDAVRAVARLADVTLLVAGRGPLEDEVAALGASLAPGRVRMLGETADPSRLLAAADVLLVPSRTEGMPGVVIEAEMRGIPVVATAVGAVASMVRDGADGLLVAPGDPIALAGALSVVLEQLASYYGLGSGAAVERFGQVAVVSQWEELIAALAAAR